MPNPRLPPLNALRTFEAVARNRSFRKAAEELFVTPAAVSHQIKQLEEQLGLELFRRGKGPMQLTEAAQAALPRFQQAFDLLGQAVSELRRYGRTPVLTIGGTPTFVSRWLMPRLQGFLHEHPNIDVRLFAKGELILPGAAASPAAQAENTSPDTDIEIRFSSTPPPGQYVDLLFPVEVVPICHPRLIAGPPPLRVPADLRHHTLLHGDGRNADRSNCIWARWMRLAGLTDIDPHHGVQFNHSQLALEAAADGLGVVLATPKLAASEIAQGKAVVAFQIPMPLNMSYYAIASESAVQRPEVAAFRKWLIEEAAR